jgi:hypothetical protein
LEIFTARYSEEGAMVVQQEPIAQPSNFAIENTASLIEYIIVASLIEYIIVASLIEYIIVNCCTSIEDLP